MGGVIDYNELWKLYSSIRKKGEERDSMPGEFWDSFADHYDRSVRKNPQNTERELIQLDIQPGDTVLDIGAGTGRLAVPIAQRAKWVTAVEPSSSMIRYLEKNMVEAGLENYSCINSNWEDVSIPLETGAHDVVISAFALGFLDLQMALKRMDQAASRKVFIFWFAGSKHDDGLVDYVFRAKDKIPVNNSDLPDYICVLNILHDMGIDADLSINEYEWYYPFNDIDEAVSMAIHQGRIGIEDRDLAFEYYGRMLKEEKNGIMILKTTADQALMSWEKN